MNQKYCKQSLYNRKKFKNFDGSGIGMPNTKIFVNENLTISNHQLQSVVQCFETFQCFSKFSFHHK